MRLLTGGCAGIVVCTLLAVATPGTSPAQAQQADAGKSAQTAARSTKPRAPETAAKNVKKDAAKKDAAKTGQAERPAFTAAEAEAAVIPGIPDARAFGDSETAFARLLPTVNGPWLAISGGGADGAYGAGVLVGWSAAGNRPEFAVVTGSSIGALVAPFAFLGPRYDDEIRKSFTTISAADVFEDRVTRDSLLDSWPLRKLIEQRVTPQLLGAIATEHARGRRLLIATTHLDSGRRMVWNMGAIAARGDEAALKLFRDILAASAAIPGFFSPVAIEVEANGRRLQELHNDGTIISPFLVVPETMLSAGSKSQLPFSTLYVIVNSKTTSEFSMTDRTIVGVLSRSIAVALTAALRTEAMLILATAQRRGIDVRVAFVDSAFDHPSRGAFDGKYMQALFEFGFAAGKNGAAFSAAPAELSVHGASR